VHLGDERDLEELAEELVAAGLQLAPLVERPGQLAVRGGILDVFPLAAQNPVRIEFFDATIDGLRHFDAFSQESTGKISQATLTVDAGTLRTTTVWQLIGPQPILVLADLPLRERLQKPPHATDFPEIRLARQLQHDDADGASLSIERFIGDASHDLQEIRAAQTEGLTITVLARNEEASAAVTQQLGEAAQTDTTIVVARLQRGWRDQERGELVIHDFELNHRQPVRKKRRVVPGGSPLSSLSDLRHGDLVVHLNHGIARFQGMATLEKRGYLEDFLLLEFAEESKLYVPVTGIELIQKYISAGGKEPDLSKIGSATWKKRTAKAEKAIADMTAELLQTQANRQGADGIAFGDDPAPLHRFAAAFPYEETEDQLAAWREIRQDMTEARPMDRLLCGDVGFGKTEVAMRAAAKAVLAGYQVAVLAPTTLLAEQHFESFQNRFSAAKVDASIGCMTRFRKTSEKNALLEQTANGDIDILIGTHALLSKKLRVPHLGLLIIDEEQRFGVKHKEHLKALRTGVDVLTLSATPIPRTLHFSLLGLRQISVIAEPPPNRLAIKTRVTRYDDELIEQACLREIERGGQIFFLHNRVQDIDQVANDIAKLLPQIKVDTVHGQMSETRISDVMRRFQYGETNCLVASSIIESGIDIPNANTLFVNNAHRFGLGQLHQIRGRIGRYSHQAYAYFFAPANEQLNNEAMMRLDAIAEYAELGAGFKLAMRDLEIRGAGNLLGGEQSGHMDAIGYELYCKLLAESMKNQGLVEDAAALKAMAGGKESAATLAFACDAYIPDDYLESPQLKFELHKRLDDCRHQRDLTAVVAATRDRYGALPEQVARLFRLRGIRLAAARHDINRIELKDRHLRLHLAGQLPAELASRDVPDVLHIQLDGNVLVLFAREALTAATGIPMLEALFAIDWGESLGEKPADATAT
jgi:transcription-repair coupling factor (superfamily II helicase)